MKQCSNCGADLEDSAVFCNNCGTKAEVFQQVEQPIVQPTQQPIVQPTQQPIVQPIQQPIVQPMQVQVPEQPEFVKCNYCGEMVPSNMQVCNKCGAQLKFSKQANVETAAGDFFAGNVAKLKIVGQKGITGIKKAAESDQVKGLLKDKKKILTIAIPVAAVLILLIIINVVISGGAIYDTYGSKTIEYVDAEGTITFLTSGKVVAEIDETMAGATYNLSQTKAALLTEFDNEDGGNLYTVDASGEKLVDEDVWSYVLSDSGKGVAYLKDYDYEENTATLMLYNGSKSKVISDEVYASTYNGFNLVISPDGKTVAFITYEDEPVGFVSTNGKSPKELGEYTICFAVADDAKYIYYIDADEDTYETDVYVKKGSKENKLISNSSDSLQFTFNKNYSQAIFINESKSYITVNGKEKKKVGASYLYPLIPYNSQVKYSNNTLVYAVDDFAGKLFLEDGDIIYMNKKFDTHKVANEVSSAAVSKDLKTVVYNDYSENLYVVKKVSSDNPKEKELDKAEDVLNFTMTSDASKIYYVNDDEELCVISQKNKSKKIADDVSSDMLSLVGKKVFFITDYSSYTGTLCYTTGSKKQKVSGADDVSSFYRLGTGLIYYAESSVYGSPNGSKFKMLAEDVYSN